LCGWFIALILFFIFLSTSLNDLILPSILQNQTSWKLHTEVQLITGGFGGAHQHVASLVPFLTVSFGAFRTRRFPFILHSNYSSVQLQMSTHLIDCWDTTTSFAKVQVSSIIPLNSVVLEKKRYIMKALGVCSVVLYLSLRSHWHSPAPLSSLWLENAALIVWSIQ